MAAVPELGRASHAEEVADALALSRWSAPISFPPSALCSYERHDVLHPAAPVPQVGLPFRFHCQPRPYATRQGLHVGRAQPAYSQRAPRGPLPPCTPSLSGVHCIIPPRCLANLPHAAVLSWGRWIDGLPRTPLSSALCRSHLLASAGLSAYWPD